MTGNRTAKGNFLTGTMETYTYDDIYQLKHVNRDSTSTEDYTYDRVGNRLMSLDVASYGYNSSNQLTSADATSFTYDHNGNTTTKTDTNGQTTYVWDIENRLTSVTMPTGVVTFKYDPFGRRIQKSSASGTTIYVYDGANGVEEVNAAGTVVARYIQGAGIDEPRAQSRSGLSYYNADGLGSITSMEDATGTPMATLVYGAFGVLNSSTGSNANPYRYTAREYDSETGLYYYRARYYDSSTARFLNEDPMKFLGGVDMYIYALNDPISLTDPWGWMPKGKDKWYGHNDPHFHKWFHRCWKEPGDPDATKEEIEIAYQEWLSRGKPQNGNCYGPGPESNCKQKTMFEIQQEEMSAHYMEDFWTDILIGDAALGIVGTAGAMGWLEGAIGGGTVPRPRVGPRPVPQPKSPPQPRPVPLRPAA